MVEERETSVVPVKVGDDVTGTVEHIAAYGAFVRLATTGQKAMIHISELSHSFIKKVEDVLEVGQSVTARVIKIDERGRIDLSIKALKPREARPVPRSSPEDFEKRLSSFLKVSDEKIAELNNKNKGKGGGKHRTARG